MQTVANVKVQLLHAKARLPEKAHASDAGFDLYFCPTNGEEIRLSPGGRSLLSCGFAMELPPGWEAQVRSRSGLAMQGLIVMNSPGTIDSGYRGEVRVILMNLSPSTHTVTPGDRIAQMVIQRVPHVELTIVGSLGESDRGDNGFGSTGVRL